MEENKSIFQILGDSSSSLMKSPSERLPAHLIDLHTKLSQALRNIEDPEEFVICSLIRWLVGDFLRLTIEDSYMDFSGSEKLSRRFVQLLQQLSQKPSRQPKWFHALEKFIEVYRKWALDKRLSPARTYLTKEKEIPIALAYDNIPFQVSSQHAKILPNLDFILSDPSAARSISKRFIQELEKIRSEAVGTKEVSMLCFVEKSYGPVGGLSFATHLVIQAGLPATVYRPERWLEVTRIAGALPSPDDVVCLVYDFVVTGGALVEAARFLRDWCRCTVSHAIVYFEFDPEGRKKLMKNGIELISLANLSDQEPQVEEVFRHYAILEENLDQALEAIRAQAPHLSEEEYVRQIEEKIKDHHTILQEGMI